jgi:signal transduction histidine kinase
MGASPEDLDAKRPRAASVGELHHKLVELYAPPSVLVGADLEVLHLSERVGRYLALRGGEPTRDLLRLVRADLRAALCAAIDAVRRDGLLTDRRVVRAQLDGEEQHVEITVRVSDELGGALLVMFDERAAIDATAAVTELEDELHRTRAQLRTTVELAQRAAEAGLWELDVATRRVRMSEEGMRTHGHELAEGALSLDAWLGRVHHADRELASLSIHRAISGHEDLSVEVRVLHPTRGLRWLWISGRHDDGHGPVRTLSGITVDVTERRRTEAALRASEERFRLALRTAPVVMLSQDRELRYTWGYMLGGPVDFIGKTDADLFPRSEAEAMGAIKRAVLEDGVARRQELALTVSGETRYYDFNVEAIRGEGDAIMGVSSAAVDVTASKLAELALRDADRRKDDFLATLSHELRNPLAPLQAALDIQQLADGDLGRIERARTLMERQVSQIVRLVDDLLDVARITQGKIQLRFARTSVQAVVDAALEATRPAIEAGGHLLDVHLPEETIALEADFARITQVVANLLSNAAKYTPAGGSISVIAGPDLARTHLVLRVKDNGVGIASEMLPHVFDLFAQPSEAMEHAQGGSAVGLSLVRRLVELHGGTVEAHSAGTGQGSEFVMRLPLTRDKERAMAAIEPRVRAKTGASRRVLVVDDNRDVTESICELLEMIGHVTEQALDGNQALAAYTTFGPDVVLLDLGLPGMSGFEVAERIRAAPHGTEVVLVAVTGWGQPADLVRSQEAGFDHHLVKPAGLAALREIVGDGRVTS